MAARSDSRFLAEGAFRLALGMQGAGEGGLGEHQLALTLPASRGRDRATCPRAGTEQPGTSSTTSAAGPSPDRRTSSRTTQWTSGGHRENRHHTIVLLFHEAETWWSSSDAAEHLRRTASTAFSHQSRHAITIPGVIQLVVADVDVIPIIAVAKQNPLLLQRSRASAGRYIRRDSPLQDQRSEFRAIQPCRPGRGLFSERLVRRRIFSSLAFSDFLQQEPGE